MGRHPEGVLWSRIIHTAFPRGGGGVQSSVAPPPGGVLRSDYTPRAGDTGRTTDQEYFLSC